MIIRYNASSVPILQYSLASKKFSEQELQDLAMNRVKVGLSTVRGASVPYPAGGKTRVVAVDIDLAALQARNLAPQEVVNAFNAQNFILPSGTAKIGATEYNVSLNTNPQVLAALNDLPIKTVNGAVIRVGDVAQVHDGYQPQQNVVRLDGVRGVLLTVLKSGAASTLQRRGRGEKGHAADPKRAAARAGRQGIRRPVAFCPGGRERRGQGRGNRRAADGGDDPALSRFLAEHFYYRPLDPAFDL